MILGSGHQPRDVQNAECLPDECLGRHPWGTRTVCSGGSLRHVNSSTVATCCKSKWRGGGVTAMNHNKTRFRSSINQDLGVHRWVCGGMGSWGFSSDCNTEFRHGFCFSGTIAAAEHSKSPTSRVCNTMQYVPQTSRHRSSQSYESYASWFWPSCCSCFWCGYCYTYMWLRDYTHIRLLAVDTYMYAYDNTNSVV